mmetsp:Transcript_12809/g.30501  ORF Transcript_12809/g.30501 Transcript_12809/m.30501 type:complete len:229 (-) Transcript_12809:141-827(-)
MFAACARVCSACVCTCAASSPAHTLHTGVRACSGLSVTCSLTPAPRPPLRVRTAPRRWRSLRASAAPPPPRSPSAARGRSQRRGGGPGEPAAAAGPYRRPRRLTAPRGGWRGQRGGAGGERSRRSTAPPSSTPGCAYAPPQTVPRRVGWQRSARARTWRAPRDMSGGGRKRRGGGEWQAPTSRASARWTGGWRGRERRRWRQEEGPEERGGGYDPSPSHVGCTCRGAR